MLLQLILRSVGRPRPRLTYIMLRNNSSFGVGKSTTVGDNSYGNEKDSDIAGYYSAIQKLNTLQSNAASIRQSIMNKQVPTNLEDTVKYLNRSGLSLDQLDRLSVIHVSGTKGKGSTCAITESILREYGVRTGFFSSPHLVSVTERIRINGEAISKQKFTKYFWKVFNELHKQKESNDDLPAYFKFLTILCFHVFLEEKVDVAIIEVGIGGENDATNIVRNTSTVGITSLSLEHTNILGDTLEEIAIQKSGIIKPFSKVYTNVQQAECLEIIKKRAAQKDAFFVKVPEISDYKWPNGISILNLNKMVQLNGSLAIHLAYNWLKESGKVQNELSEEFKTDKNILITERVVKALSNCVWPGRCQTFNFGNFRIHFDGAHTPESMKICSDWFKSSIRESEKIPKVLIFNATGERDSKALLGVLGDTTNFDAACFVTNVPFNFDAVGDIHSLHGHQEQILKAELHERNWREIKNQITHQSGVSRIFGTTIEAFFYLKKQYENENIEILVTGSIHLLGATILALEEFEKFCQKDNFTNLCKPE